MKIQFLSSLVILFCLACDSKSKGDERQLPENSQANTKSGGISYQPPDSSRIPPEKIIVTNLHNPFVTVVFGKAEGVSEMLENGWVVYEFPDDNILITKLKYRAGWKQKSETKAYLKDGRGELKEVKIVNVRDGTAQSDTCEITYRQFVLETNSQIDEEKIWKSIMNRLGCEYWTEN